ncbi:MAG TPA: zinc-ribbon domain-containing protein [bacterium]
MVVECPSCKTRYNVDENKLPPAGVKVRCHKCQNIIIIKKPAPPPVVEPVAPAPVPPPPIPEPKTPEVVPPSIPEPAPKPEPPKPEIKAPIIETPAPAPSPPDVTPPTFIHEPVPVVVQPTPAPAGQLSAEDKKWHERAKRLAKALASDLVLYNQTKVEQGLRNGTLVQLLGSEIRRSWEYYCQQIPKHIVESTDYFKEQLNKVVGKGKELFK